MKTALALSLALALAAPAAAPAQELLPPPPPPPGSDDAGAPTPPASSPAPRGTAARPKAPKGVIGEGPVAAAGSVGAGLDPDERLGTWKYALASGLTGRFKGYQLHTDQANSSVLLYFGGQADGLWTDGIGRAARLRFMLYTGGDGVLFLPSDGEIEAAYALGRREFRFVVGRLEVSRYPGLAIQTMTQLATLPSFEGSIPLAGDKVRLFYAVSPVEAAWVYYYGRAHDEAGARESDEPRAATAARARVTFNVPPSILLSLQGDYLKMWGVPDLLLGAEASAGMAILDRSVLISASMRWQSYRRRGGTTSGGAADFDAQSIADQFLGQATATLVF